MTGSTPLTDPRRRPTSVTANRIKLAATRQRQATIQSMRLRRAIATMERATHLELLAQLDRTR